MLADTALKLTPLHDIHLALRARMVPFGGWQMPLQYEGILAEYQSTRCDATIFDTCHMGEFEVEGDPISCGLNQLVTCSLADMPPLSCRYGLLLNEHGGVIDDLIVYRKTENKWMIVVNASTMENDARQFQSYLSASAKFENISHRTGKLDIQGPQSREVLKNLVPGIERLKYYTFDIFPVLGEEVIVSRTGYTGELGYEIYFPWERTALLWQEICRSPLAKPAGLGVRDVLRMEMGYSLYGHELDEMITPLEADLSKFVDFEKDFIGKAALLRQKAAGPRVKLAGFISSSRRSPRQNYGIYSPDGTKIGTVTSGTFSPALNRGIGMGFINREFGKTQETIFFGQPDERSEARLSPRPFYKEGSLKD